MNLYLNIGRIFLGICLIGIGVLHFFYPGIRPIILPDKTQLPSNLIWVKYVIALLLISTGLLICANKKTMLVAFIVGVVFFLLFLFGHLPAYLSAITRSDKLKYWVNLNKTLAISGGFLVLASINAKKIKQTKFDVIVSKMWLPGRCFFAIMLFLFGIGHLLSTASLSAMVPSYIPFAKFWTFVGGIILVGSAISIVINFKLKLIAYILAVTLFIWLISLHFYYAFLFPEWQEGENFIGSLTCMAFCGTVLLISQASKNNLSKKSNR